MAANPDESEDTLKHNWLGQGIAQQTSFARFFGHCEYHDVPRTHLLDKLESCYKMITDEGKAKKYSGLVEKRILEKNPSTSQSHQLKPIFVHMTTKDFKNPGVYVIFRVRRADTGKPIYVDQIRTYSNWKDFLENNTLPKGYVFYPEVGNYTPETKFKMDESAACSVSKIVRTVVEVTANTTFFVSSAALVATAVFPVLAPATIPLSLVSAGASVVLGVDGVIQVTDQITHDENMSPTNPRALATYLEIGSACGGLAAGVASAAIKTLPEDAALLAKALRYVKYAGSAVQGISFIGKCIASTFEEFSFEDFKEFCLCCLNIIVHEVIPYAKSFINFFMLGFAVYRGNIIQTLRTLNGAKECTVFFFRALLPEVLRHFGSHMMELTDYFINLFCNKLTPHLPALIDTDQFHVMKRDFFSVIEKVNVFFNVSDILDIKFNGFSFFLTFSFTGLRLVFEILEKHLHCQKSGKPHELTQPELIKLWFKFMDLIRCCSPNNLVHGTTFLLKMISKRKEMKYSPVCPKMLTYYADSFLDKQSNSYEFNENVALFPTLDGMQVHEFYVPTVGDDVSVLSDELKSFYRKKVEIIIRQEVTSENSSFGESGSGYNSILHLSSCHEWRAAVFNRTILKNGKAMLFVTLFQ